MTEAITCQHCGLLWTEVTPDRATTWARVCPRCRTTAPPPER